MSDCLSMRGVWKSYQAGVRGCSATVSVLRGVNLDVQVGDVVGVVGAQGAGKSTLLMCAAGLLRPDEGSVSWFGGARLRDLSARPDGIAYAGDRPFPYGFLSAREALEYAGIVRDLPLRDSADRVASALERTGLAAIAHRRVDTLSGGAAARLAVAGALLAHPRLVLVDDLPGGCDAATALELIALLRVVAGEGAGVVIAGRLVPWLIGSEQPHAAPSVRVVLLESGRLDTAGERPVVAARRATAPLSHARVAEITRQSAPENRAR
jgi:ABC-type multidrug transport system ATPase subunit